jgi:hypothetical protein
LQEVNMTDEKEKVATYTAVGALVLFVIGVYLLYAKVGVSDPEWSRLTYLLTGIEAVAFAGVGFLWGKEVHRSGLLRAVKALQALRNQIGAQVEAAQRGLQGLPDEMKRWQDLHRLATDLA